MRWAVFTVTDACVGCGACLATCPERALRAVRPAQGRAPLTVVAERCSGCAECLEVCPADACVPVSSGGLP